MSADSKGVDISIMGRKFRVACAENEQKELLEAVAYLDRKMREIRDQGKVVGLERIAIMAALNVTYELLTLHLADGFDIAEFKRRMTHMQAALDRALTEQEKLF
ncbi:MAG TPA: cell division protein ZapA [Burkholderiales bacterium]|nr:cell division protein ZapA [Burkholderiales bacterium]